MQRLQPMQYPCNGSKIKISKNMSKSILKIISSCSVKKAAPKRTKYWRNEAILKIKKKTKQSKNETILKSAIVQRLQPMLTPHFASKIKILKTKSETILQIYCSCSVQNTAPKNVKYSRNETILNIGHHAKAIAHAKS